MKRPSKFRVLLAVNRWRITHGKAPILRLPKGNPRAANSCPLARALGVWGVGNPTIQIGHAGAGPPDEKMSALLSDFVVCFDRGLYPELIS